MVEGISKSVKQKDSAIATAEDTKAKLILTISPSLHIKDASSKYDLWEKLTSMFAQPNTNSPKQL